MKNYSLLSGQGEWVEIEFKDKNLINPIVYKFGLDADIKKVNENTVTLKTKANVGEGFYN